MGREKRPATALVASKVTKRYNPVRAVKRSQKEWDRYKPLFKRLWIECDMSVDAIRQYVLTGHREDFSARQIQNHMEQWGWRKYNTSKREKDASESSDALESPESGDKVNLAADAGEQPQPAMGAQLDKEMFDMTEDTSNICQSIVPIRCEHYNSPEKLQADVAMAIGDPQTAFSTCVKLCDEHHHPPRFRNTSIDLLLTTCFRAASTVNEKQQAAKLLERFQTPPDHEPELALQVSLLEAYNNLAHMENGKVTLRQVNKMVLHNARWSQMAQPFTVADLGTWQAISRAILLFGDERSKSDKIPAHDQDFLMTQPVNSWVTSYELDDIGRPSAFLDCLDWATKQHLICAQTSLEVPHLFRGIRIEGTLYQRINHLILFSSLLRVALEEQQELFWWLQSEPEISIPPITLLSTICHMILNEPPFDEDEEGPHPCLQSDLIQGSDFDIILLSPGSSLVVAAKEISKRASEYLWSNFLAILATQDMTDPLDEEILSPVMDYFHTLLFPQEMMYFSDKKVEAYLETRPPPGNVSGPDDLRWSGQPPFTEEFIGGAECPFSNSSNFEFYPEP